MRNFLIIFPVLILSTQQCSGLPLVEAVASVYITHPSTMATNPPKDVYHIANNIAEKITSPLNKFLGINGVKSENTTKPLEKIELQDDHDLAHKPKILRKKTEKKPEKITSYSKYLRTLFHGSKFSGNQADAKNDSRNELDNLPDEEVARPKEGAFIYFLELLGSAIELSWGGLMSLLGLNSSSRSGK